MKGVKTMSIRDRKSLFFDIADENGIKYEKTEGDIEYIRVNRIEKAIKKSWDDIFESIANMEVAE
jgi:hypothetical protein